MNIDTEKPIRFPEVKTFSGLFGSYIPRRVEGHPALAVVEGPLYDKYHNRRGRDRATISGHCMISRRDGRRQFIQITSLAEGVLSKMKEFIVVIDDSMDFEIIEWEDGLALVTIRHNKILGSNWLAIINFDTVPVPDED